MKPLSTEEQRETIKALLAFVKSIAPELSKIAGKREFELVITNDENGIGMSATMGWDPTLDDAEIVHEPIAEDTDLLATAKREENMIRDALIRNKGNKKKAAAELGISERTLRKKLFIINQ